MKRILIAALAAAAMVGLMGNSCEGTPRPTSNKDTQAEKARAAAETIRFTENAEIENIKRRLELTSQPGLIGYVTVINKVGQVVLYTPVMGKVTSGSKRLTRPFHFISCDKGANYGDCEVEAPSDEGTYGKSSDFVYFWTPGGQYFQTDLGYVYSDKPFRLDTKPLIDISSLTAPKS